MCKTKILDSPGEETDNAMQSDQDTRKSLRWLRCSDIIDFWKNYKNGRHRKPILVFDGHWDPFQMSFFLSRGGGGGFGSMFDYLSHAYACLPACLLACLLSEEFQYVV